MNASHRPAKTDARPLPVSFLGGLRSKSLETFFLPPWSVLHTDLVCNRRRVMPYTLSRLETGSLIGRGASLACYVPQIKQNGGPYSYSRDLPLFPTPLKVILLDLSHPIRTSSSASVGV